MAVPTKEGDIGPGDLGIRDYLIVINKRRGVILVIFLAVFILTLITTGKQIPIYRATVSVRILERKSVATLLTDWISWDPGDPIASQAEIIKSYPVIEGVVKKLGLVNKDATSEELLSAVASVQGMLKAKPIRQTNIITITIEGTDREKVTLIANEIVQSYIEENLKEKSKQARVVREFVQEQLNEVREKLRVSEEALKEFRQSGRATGIAISLQNRLADLETEKAKLLRMYTELHPDVVKINDEINIIIERMKQVPDAEVEFARLTRDVEINEKIYKDLKDKFEDARIAEIEKVPDVTLVNPASDAAPIRPNKTTNMMVGVILGLLSGLAGGFVVEQLDTSIGTIDDVEKYTNLPVLGVIPYLGTDIPREKIPLKRLFSKKEKQNLMVEMLKKQLLIYYSSQSSVAEAYRILRTNITIELLKNQTKGKVIIITSSGPEEGKSINVSNLGICLAQVGLKTLIMDIDFRRPVIHKIFGFSSRQPGLTDVLRRTVPLEDSLRSLTELLAGSIGFEKILATPGIDNLNFILSGSSAGVPTELLSSPDMDIILKKLKEKFDIILIDSSPVLPVADVIILAQKADAVLLVYKVGKTASTAIMRSKKQLEAAGASLKGIILNNISPQMEMRSQYYYHHYRYYPPGKEEK